jgi:hypothetical protein
VADLEGLRAALDAERDPDRWLDLAVDYINELADALDDDVEAMLVTIDGRLAETAPERAIAIRRRLAEVLEHQVMHAEACAQLAAAAAVTQPFAQQIEIELERARLLRWDGREDEGVALLRQLVARVDERSSDPDVTARVHLTLAETVPAEAERHARVALELARDPKYRAEATHRLGSVLFDRDELDVVEQLITALPSPPLHVVALHEHVLRRQGRLSEEVPSHELDEPPVVPGEGFDGISPEYLELIGMAGGLAPRVIAFFTPPGDVATTMREHPLGNSDEIRNWSLGPVTSEADLDSEKIFGPKRSYHCACGRYRGNRYVGFVCERCRVELLPQRVRAGRVGHLTLHEPVVHPWFVDVVARLLDLGPNKVKALPGSELIAKLEDANPFIIADEVARRLQWAHDAARLRLEPRAELIAAIQSAGRWISLRSFALEMVPVLSPQATLPGVDMAKVQLAYRRMLVEQRPSAAVRALFACFTSRAAADSRS